MPDEPDTLSPQETAALLGTTDVRIRSLCHCGRVPGAAQDLLGHWRIPRASLDAIPTSRFPYADVTTQEIDLAGTDTDTRVGAITGRGTQSVRDIRLRNGIPAYPGWAPPERQIPRMTTSRLLSLRDMIEAELQRRS